MLIERSMRTKDSSVAREEWQRDAGVGWIKGRIGEGGEQR